MPTLKDVDQTASDELLAEFILSCNNPVVIKDFQPKQVVWDDKCMYRAVSSECLVLKISIFIYA